ncbi:MAG: hypothetical protein H6Q36_1251 [Chloroflexi bacterium]|nr:hypothetical protein [Chloroflexota bacterium]
MGVEQPFAAFVKVTEVRQGDEVWSSLDAVLENLVGNGRSGTAVVGDTGIVLHWSCAEGP